jgi:dTDP-4-dehydrorhamnose 3,5-epimerase
MLYVPEHYYTPGVARGVRFDDPVFGIRWPLEATVISNQDRVWPLIEQ